MDFFWKIVVLSSAKKIRCRISNDPYPPISYNIEFWRPPPPLKRSDVFYGRPHNWENLYLFLKGHRSYVKVSSVANTVLCIWLWKCATSKLNVYKEYETVLTASNTGEILTLTQTVVICTRVRVKISTVSAVARPIPYSL